MAEHLRLPSNPVLYEINTWVWLNDLSTRAGRSVTLDSVSKEEWDAIAALGFDAVWLMGVWERSPAGRSIALQTDTLLAEFMRVLPDFTVGDVAGSPYCIRNYVVDAALGGRAGLANARAALAERGMALLLDFVPNHVAPDHPWTESNPEYFVQGSDLELVRSPQEFLGVGKHVYARGRDPYFAPWPDVVQLNAFAPDLRRQVIATLLEIADQCDGVRCDMAMLMNTEVFARTWGARAGAPPAVEYWTEVFAAVKAAHPHFVWMAEVYWDMEWRMQQLGFDYCYDKRLYDRLVIANLGAPGTVEDVRGHLHAEIAYQQGLVRFAENHDEPRAAAAFPPERLRAVTLATSTHLGVRLFHEGQLEGRHTKVPVFLGRRPRESTDPLLREWMQRLLAALRTPVLHEGTWQLCTMQDVDGDESSGNIVAWCWHDAESGTLAIAAVNLGAALAQGRAGAIVAPSAGRWQLHDALDPAGRSMETSTAALQGEGMHLSLAPWAAHLWIG